jgi:phosphatidylglycerol:prolipoprotein diacylglycerol transferase
MKPIPVVFHIGALQIHTYGIGLAITFWFGYRYFARRLRNHGYPDAWLGKAFVWIIVASVVGARAASVVSNWGFYSRNLGDILAVWHGGLSSYGGLALGVPTGLICARRWCRELRLTVALDIVSPVLVIAWAVGRLLGPQLMVAGGGPATKAWYGLAYAGQVGKRVPVPLWQAFECFVIWLIALAVERFVAKRGGPIGVVATVVVTLYGLSRFFDEYLFLSHGTAGDLAVEVTSLVFVGVGLSFAGWLVWRDHKHLASRLAMSASSGPIGDPWRSPLAGAVENAGNGDAAAAVTEGDEGGKDIEPEPSEAGPTAGDPGGRVTAGDSVTAGDPGGRVTAGDSVTAGDRVTAGDPGDRVTAGDPGDA